MMARMEDEPRMTADIRQQILAPLATSETAWCGFDADWYLAANPECDGDAAAALEHYLEIGRRQGRAPNMYFDESWYRACNPDVAAAISTGEIGSGYEHYCAVGYLTRAPHWLYDDDIYAQYAPDLTDQVLVTYGCANRYDHYLKAGAREGRVAHLLFQPAIYAEAMTGSPDGTITGANNAFQHYLRHIWLGGAEIATSVYFDPAWYLAQCPVATAAIASGRALCALHHFLTAPRQDRGDPVSAFSSAFYAAQTPVATEAVASGFFDSVYEHFLKVGVFTLQPPASGTDLLAYLSRSPTARGDVESGRVRDLFAHLLTQPEPPPPQEAPVKPDSPPPSVSPPPARTDGAEVFGSHLMVEADDTILCPPDGLVISGWMLAPPGAVAGISVICGKRRIPLDPAHFVATPRLDVLAAMGEKYGYSDPYCGFLAYVPALLEPGEQPMLEVTRATGGIVLRPIPEPTLHGLAAIRTLLDRFELRYSALARGFDHTIGPAIEALAVAHRGAGVSREILDYGVPDSTPDVSVIIPLYGRIDLMESQLALFSAHPPGISHELIYILDDPPRRTETLELAESLLARFALPFRLVLLSRNVGYGPANNIGLAIARGRQVCLLNSDVFPRDANWLARLSERLDATPGLAAVGPLLLFEDDSVQHQGIAFEPLPEFAGWMFPMHVGKGRRPGPRRGLQRFQAITGACFMIARDTLRGLGGLDESYAIGDFEDVDLCMRLGERGMACGVDMDVAMYHLERQSQAGPVLRWRMNLTLVNAWLHQRRWGKVLAKAAQP